MFQHITLNIGGKVRREILEGRKHLVVPVAFLAEAVLAGSDGPLFYPEEENKKGMPQWNGRPIVINHPAGGTACEPEFIENAKVGVLLRTKWDRKLRSEAWLDEERLEKLAKPVAEAIVQNKMVEVSSGLNVDIDAKPGKFKNKSYTGVARNHRPDHLAILTDSKGAYSITDGGGLMQLNEEYPDEVEELIRNTVRETLESAGISSASLSKENDMAKKEIVDGLITNKATKWEESDRTYLMTLEEKQLEKFAPVEVKNEGEDPTKKTKEREQEVKEAGAKGGAGIVPPVVKNDETKEIPTPKKEEPPKKPLTANEYVAQAPPEVAAILNQGMLAYKQQKDALIEVITKNSANTFSKEFLATKEIPELQGLASLASSSVPVSFAPPQQNQPSYFGAVGGGVPQQNSAHTEEPLVPLTMNFEKESKE